MNIQIFSISFTSFLKGMPWIFHLDPGEPSSSRSECIYLQSHFMPLALYKLSSVWQRLGRPPPWEGGGCIGQALLPTPRHLRTPGGGVIFGPQDTEEAYFKECVFSLGWPTFSARNSEDNFY